MMLLLLACASTPHPAPEDSASPAAPTVSTGTFAVTVATEWSGDCEFSDTNPDQQAQQEWTFDPRDDILVLYKDYWNVETCTHEGTDFSCDDGSWKADRMQVTLLTEGGFPTEDTLQGQLVVELDCTGTGCDTLIDEYGRHLEFPCRSEAAFDGVLE